MISTEAAVDAQLHILVHSEDTFVMDSKQEVYDWRDSMHADWLCNMEEMDLSLMINSCTQPSRLCIFNEYNDSSTSTLLNFDTVSNVQIHRNLVKFGNFDPQHSIRLKRTQGHCK